MKARIYARYSTDRQLDTSIDDQVRLGTIRAKYMLLEIDKVYADPDVSGSVPVAQRATGAELLRDSEIAPFVLIIESLARLTRDLLEQERIIRRLEFVGVRIVTLIDGYDSKDEGRVMMRGIRGVFNQQAIADISKMTHRGLSARVDKNQFAGGIAYGYTSIEVPNGRELKIDLEQADTVLGIFVQYAEGKSVQRIVAEMNEQRITAPRGGTWAVGAIYGSPAKGTGILNNELYIGRYIWNRSKWVRDPNPDSRKRHRIERPRSEWMIQERPDLRIIPQEIWDEVRARMKVPTTHGGNSGRGSRPSTLFGGLLRCGICGGSVVAVNATQYGCASRKDRGAVVCTGILAPRKATDTRLLSLIRDDLLSPEAIAFLQSQVHALLRELSKPDTDREARAKSLDAEISRLVDAVAKSGGSDALLARLSAAEADRRSMSAVTPAKIGQIPDVMARYKRLLADLPGSLKDVEGEAREALRGILGPIRLTREGPELWANLEVDPGRLLLTALDRSGSGGAIPVLSIGMPVRIRIV